MGTEHLLLGILAEPEDLAVRILQNLGVNLDEVRQGLSIHLEKTRS